MNNIFILWLPLSISLAAFVGLVIVLVAVMRNREEQSKLLAVFEQLCDERSANEQQQQIAEQCIALKKQLAVLNKQVSASVDNNIELEQQLNNIAHRQAALEQQLLQQQEAIQEV